MLPWVASPTSSSVAQMAGRPGMRASKWSAAAAPISAERLSNPMQARSPGKVESLHRRQRLLRDAGQQVRPMKVTHRHQPSDPPPRSSRDAASVDPRSSSCPASISTRVQPVWQMRACNTQCLDASLLQVRHPGAGCHEPPQGQSAPRHLRRSRADGQPSAPPSACPVGRRRTSSARARPWRRRPSTAPHPGPWGNGCGPGCRARPCRRLGPSLLFFPESFAAGPR